MPRGGKREGAGRKKQVELLKAAVVTMNDQMPVDALAIVMARCPPGANSLEMINHVRLAPETPPDLKLKLAVAAMPFEIPKPERAKDPDADNEKVKLASDERVKSRLADLLGKAGASGALDGGSAPIAAPAAAGIQSVSEAAVVS